ncbi:MAG: molecular chaperone HtpG [Erysipelotrichaceae bacterium]|nr:molecular chaperone HtpG [Clostridia bacterium]MBQ6217332.1 molecular chaperone HtpG [Erysipelotrichaceae bacterium]
MAIKEFKTESKRLLDMMANSIYTNTDIFLRELISNASDALDKRHILSLTDNAISFDDPKIHIDVNKADRIITISDNGIGMDRKELEDNLGTIARSGSFEFKKELDEKQEADIIGQFGVGFYSAFMVADKVEVRSKKVKEDKAYLWTSDMNGYEITACDKEEPGTTITLHVKKNTKEKKYDQYLDTMQLRTLVKKYSDFIRYPIEMMVESYDYKEDGKSEKVNKLETVNSMQPIWKKNKKDIKEEDYENFYMQEYYDYSKPLKTIHYKVEGNTSYTALLFIPSQRPFNFYTNDYKLGLKLYSRGVFIKDEAKEIVSDYFRFIRGVVDSDDLSLNISREILQQDYQMNALKKSVDKKIKSTLEKMLEKEREDYEKFFDAFGSQLKYGCYDGFGANKDVLIDLLMFKSSAEDKYVTLKEYVSRMKEGQNEIYYAAGESIDKIRQLPQMEKVLEKGYEVLYFTDSVDEFLTSIIMEYDGKQFKSILKGDLDLDTKEEKEELEKKNEESKDLLSKIKEVLKDKVSEVRLSSRLKTYPVCLVSDNNLSIEMEKILKQMNQDGAKANKIMEINPDHELFIALKKLYEENGDISEYAQLLYDQAALMAGLELEDPADYALKVSKLMLKALNK